MHRSMPPIPGRAADATRASALFPALLLLLAACSRADAGTTPVVGLPCEDCEVPLIGMPADPPAVARLAPGEEPGERLRLTGRVTDAQGRPRPGVIVYGHQTNQRGVYPGEKSDRDPGARRHGRLRAWATTDAEGNYTFLSIRPGSYPGTRMPQHIHLYVIETGCALYYIDDVLFRDDPHLTPAAARKADHGRGGSGIVTPAWIAGAWLARRDIVLGRNIPGYPGCAQ
ncbi:dioxygenase family protein [Pseudoxanthomonas beigongshangi]